MSRVPDASEVAMLVDMGFEESQVRAALKKFKMDDAVNWLLSGGTLSPVDSAYVPLPRDH